MEGLGTGCGVIVGRAGPRALAEATGGCGGSTDRGLLGGRDLWSEAFRLSLPTFREETVHPRRKRRSTAGGSLINRRL